MKRFVEAANGEIINTQRIIKMTRDGPMGDWVVDLGDDVVAVRISHKDAMALLYEDNNDEVKQIGGV
jgi:hypothetical protein